MTLSGCRLCSVFGVANSRHAIFNPPLGTPGAATEGFQHKEPASFSYWFVIIVCRDASIYNIIARRQAGSAIKAITVRQLLSQK
jgi:hypothetical protein